MPVAPIAMGVSAASSLFSANNQKNAQKSNESSQGALDAQLESIYQTMLNNYNKVSHATNPTDLIKQSASTYGDMASGSTPSGQLYKNEINGSTPSGSFYQGEINNGLDPAVRTNANNSAQLTNQRGLSALKNQLGPALPNLAGSVKDFEENAMQSNVQLNQGLAAQDQGVRQQGAAGLAGVQNAGASSLDSLQTTGAGGLASIGTGILSMLQSMLGGAAQGTGGLAGQFGAANAAGANAGNPFDGLMKFLATNPGALGAPKAPATPGLGIALPTLPTAIPQPELGFTPLTGFGSLGTGAPSGQVSGTNTQLAA